MRNPLWLCCYVAMWLCGYVAMCLYGYVTNYVAMWLCDYYFHVKESPPPLHIPTPTAAPTPILGDTLPETNQTTRYKKHCKKHQKRKETHKMRQRLLVPTPIFEPPPALQQWELQHLLCAPVGGPMGQSALGNWQCSVGQWP